MAFAGDVESGQPQVTNPISLPPPPSSFIADMETTVTIYSSDSEGNSRLMVKYWIKIVPFADEARVTLYGI